MVHKTVLKVNISCEKCKKELLKAICGLQGVDKVEADSEKGTVTVMGEADPYAIILKVRKACKFAQFVTVGPPPLPKEKPKEPKKTCQCQDVKWPGCFICNPSLLPCPCPCPCPCPGMWCSGCWVCKPVAQMMVDYQDPTPPCSIM